MEPAALTHDAASAPPFGKVLVATEVFPPQHGGSGRWFWELYRRMPRDRVVIAAGEHALAAEFDAGHDLRLHRLPLKFSTWGIFSRNGSKEHYAAMKRLGAIVDSERPVAMHCGKALPEGTLGWLLKRWKGLPYVVYAHGEELTLAAASRELRWLTRRVFSGAALLIANCENTRTMISDDWGVAREKIAVLHPGVDTRKFQPSAADEAVRQRLGWGGRRVVLTVGALIPRKGQDMMIQALPEIRRTVPNILYSVVGGGPERDRLQELAQKCKVEDLVQFRPSPHDEELIACYQQCDLFALPNRRVGTDFEGFGIVLLEAQACGKAVLTGASGGTAETLQPHVTGEVVDCTRPETVALAVTRLIQDDSRRIAMGERGRERMVRLLDWEPLTLQAGQIFARVESK